MPEYDVLQAILTHKVEELVERWARLPLAEVKARASAVPPPRGFTAAIAKRIAEGRPAVVAEIKKASPSRGVIRADYEPESLARSYTDAGATCLSVLTDPRYFQGADEHLKQARAASALPVLRKDFLIDPYQIYESRLMGADCVLLIVAALTDSRLQELSGLAGALGMDVLPEIHDREELERALMLRTPLVGINNRNLRTFETDIRTTLDLLIDVFPDRTVVTESGIRTPDEVALLRRHGVNAFLVGESFMAAPDPGAKLRELFG